MVRISAAIAIACMFSGAALADCGVDHGARLDDSSAKLNATPVPKAAMKQASGSTARAKLAKHTAKKPIVLACDEQPCSDAKPITTAKKPMALACDDNCD